MATANLSSLFQEVGQLLGPPEGQEKFEIEARIGMFKGQRFVSSVEPKNFYRVLEYFLTHENQIYDYLQDPVSLAAEGLAYKVQNHPDKIHEAIFQIPNARVRERWAEGASQARFYDIKKTLGHVDLRNYYTRIAKSSEQIIPKEPAPVPPGAQPQAYRVKERWSFALKDQQSTDHPLWPYKIDLTRVTGYTITDKGQRVPVNTHEIELEVKMPIVNPEKDMWPGIRFILQQVQASPFAIPAHTYSNVISTFNTLFDQDIKQLEASIRKNRPGWTFHRDWRMYNPVNKPINLRKSVLGRPENLAITDKADGERKLLFIRPDGAYLIYPPQDVSKFLRVPQAGEKTSPETEQYNVAQKTANNLAGTVLDGELITLLDGTRRYLVFDILIDRNMDVRNKTFIERYKLIAELLKKNPEFPVELKEFLIQDSFYHRTNAILDSIPNKPYLNDGLIFNTISETYTDATVYKWKPVHLLTIDFSLAQDPQTPNIFYLLVKEDKSDKLVYFQGTPQAPTVDAQGAPQVGFIDAKVVTLKLPLEAGQIVELAYDVAKKTFIPQRVRHDRDVPNKASTAISVWRDIHDPIDERTIQGIDLKQMRHYHNTLKRNLLQKCGAQAHLIDIGSGNGGDVLKWRDLGINVLAVEPNPQHLQTIAQRLVESGYQQKQDRFVHQNSTVVLLQAMGQDFAQIAATFKKHFGKGRGPRPANCIAIFNALTFFYDKESSLDSLVKTVSDLLSESGHFIGIVMDGESVRDLLVTEFQLKNRLSKLKSKQYYNIDTMSAIDKENVKKKFFKNEKHRLVSADKSKLDIVVERLSIKDPNQVSEPSWQIEKASAFTDDPFGNKIKINLEDTIVSDQIEYLVDFDVLTQKLAAEGIELKESWLLKNPYLSESQEKLNQLYREFTFQRPGKAPAVIARPIVKRLPPTLAVKPVIKPVIKPAAKPAAKPVKPAVSVQIKEEIAYAADDVFVAVPEASHTILGPEERQDLKYEDTTFVRIGNFDRGICLVYAALRARIDGYIRNYNAAQQKFMTPEIRKHRKTSGEKVFGYLVTQAQTDFKTAPGLETVRKYYSTWSKAKGKLQDCQNWPWLGMYEFLANKLKTNIIVIETTGPGKFSTHKTNPTFPTTIILFFHDGIFDTLAIKQPDGSLMTTFPTDLPILAQL